MTAVRAGLATPHLVYGGGARWCLDLLRLTDPARVAWQGVALGNAASADAAVIAEARRLAPVDSGLGCAKCLAARCDVVVGWGWPGLPARVAPTPLVLVAHGIGPWTDRALAARGGATVAAVSDEAAAACGASVVVPNCVDPARLAPRLGRRATRAAWGVPEGARVALYLGRNSPEKRAAAVLAASAELPASWWVVAIGPGFGPAGRKRGARVAAPGPTDDVGSALAAADVLVCASEAEGFCYAVAEAWAVGLPVASTPVGVARGRGHLVAAIQHPAAPRDVASAVLRADAWRGAVPAARAHARASYTPEAFGRRWTEVLEAAAARGAVAAGVSRR